MTGLLRSRLARALEAGDLGIWTIDVATGDAEWSDRMAELHGIAPGTVVGDEHALFLHVHPDDRAEFDAALAQVRDVAEVVRLTYRVSAPGAPTRWIVARLTSVHDDGGPELLCAVAADATEQVRTEQETAQRRALVESLQWVQQAIISGESLADTVAGIARSATGVLGADCGVVVHPVPGEVDDSLGWTFAGVDDVGDAEPPRQLTLPATMPTVDDARVVADTADPGDLADLLASLGLPAPMDGHRSALVAPIGRAQDDARGVMVFTHPSPHFFSVTDARLAASIGSSATMAIQNAKRHEEQRIAAVLFQRQLLPDVGSEVGGMEVCVRYHPGRDGLDVGGDWYDVVELGDRRLGLAVGDVCGHGLTAAADMGQFRYSFRAAVQTSNPEQAFSLLNGMALHERRTTATVAYVEIDTTTWSCAGWSCGHLPPVIAAPDGRSVRWLGSLESGGPMLGFLDSVTVTPIRTTLAPGEVLLLYTDGLVERRGESIDEGLDRLAASFVDRSALLDDLCDELYELLADMGPEADDTALLAVRRPASTPSGPH